VTEQVSDLRAVTESVAERFRRNEIAELLARYPGLRLVPSGSMTLRVEGTLRFSANGKKTEVIEDGYDIRIEAPENFPDRMALAWETAGRIPSDYHSDERCALPRFSGGAAAADGPVTVASAVCRALCHPIPLRLFVFGEARQWIGSSDPGGNARSLEILERSWASTSALSISCRESREFESQAGVLVGWASSQRFHTSRRSVATVASCRPHLGTLTDNERDARVSPTSQATLTKRS
jgi:hypothetical protein